MHKFLYELASGRMNGFIDFQVLVKNPLKKGFGLLIVRLNQPVLIDEKGRLRSRVKDGLKNRVIFNFLFFWNEGSDQSNRFIVKEKVLEPQFP